MLENKISQISVAKRIGISISTFNAMMNGKRKMYADDLQAICYVLGVSPEVFVVIEEKDSQ